MGPDQNYIFLLIQKVAFSFIIDLQAMNKAVGPITDGVSRALQTNEHDMGGLRRRQT